MLLHILPNEIRSTFLELATFVSKVDNDFDKSEQLIINQFRKEMDLPETDYQVLNLDLETILSKLSSIDNQSKKIIMLEILAIVWADGIFDKAEKDIIKTLCTKLKIRSKSIKLMKSWIKSLSMIYSEIDTFISEEEC